MEVLQLRCRVSPYTGPLSTENEVGICDTALGAFQSGVGDDCEKKVKEKGANALWEDMKLWATMMRFLPTTNPKQ